MKQTPNGRDILTGALLVGFGVVYTATVWSRYGLGTFGAMRPGMFPTLVGSLLIIVGGLILVPALLRRAAPLGEAEPAEWRPLVTILASLAAFAFAINRIGLIPSVFLLIGLAALASDRLRPLPAAALAATICVVAVAIFRYALGFPIVLLRNPF